VNFNRLSTKDNGFGFVEVLIAILIVAACAVPVIYMVTSARSDTSRAINYLRAVELANEAIEWVSSARYSDVNSTTLAALSETLANDTSGSVKPVEIAVKEPANGVWQSDNFTADELKYSEQYNNAFFYRKMEVETVEASYLDSGLLKKVTVTVKWSEGERPSNLNVSDNRNRQVQMSVLILNDENLYY
jgi:Tfp pilus assembly protein PilV